MTKLALLTIAVAMCIPSIVFGAEEVTPYPECTVTKVSKDDITAAKAAFQMGKKAHDEAKQYDRAVIFFETAYKLDCTAVLLLHHIALCYERLGKLEKAIVAYQAFVDRAKEPNDLESVPDLQKKIEDLQEVLAKEKPEQKPAEPQSVQPVTPVQRQPIRPTEAVDSPSRSPWPIVTIVSGGVIALIGTGFYLDGSMKESNVKGQCTNYECPNGGLTSKGNSAQDSKYIGIGLGLSGLAIAGAGIIWEVVSQPEKQMEKNPPPSNQVKPWFAHNAGGVTYQGTF